MVAPLILAPLLPAALRLLPELGRWIAGDTGGKVAQAAAAAVRAVTGTDELEAADAAIAALSPAEAAALQIRLAEIARAAEADARAAELATLSATLADVQSARGQATDLARAGSGVVWSAPVVSAIVLLAFAGVLGLVLVRALPSGSETIVNMLLGTLAAMATQVVNYWLGSSAGSAAKNSMMLTRSTP